MKRILIPTVALWLGLLGCETGTDTADENVEGDARARTRAASESNRPADPTRSRGSADAAPGTEGSFLPSVSVRVTGAVDTTTTRSGDEFTMAGGCDGSSPVSLGFQSGSLIGEDWTYVAFDTGEAVATGETGSFAVEEIRWDHGTFVPDDLPAGVETRVPDRFTGPGTLTVTTHDATMRHATSGSRRMTGIIRGDELTNQAGETVDLEAEFDIPFSCGVNP